MVELKIWNNLLENKFVNSSWDFEEKLFAINTSQNNIQFLKNNYKNIRDHTIRHKCWLIAGAYANDPNILKFLIDVFKINVNYVNHKSENCLIIACKMNQHLEVIKFIINELDVSIDHKTDTGDNCLSMCCWMNPSLYIVKYLIEVVKMNPYHMDGFDNTCLILACWKNTLEIIEYLVRLGLNPNQANCNGDTGLILACQYNSCKEIVRYLVDIGSNVNQMNINGDNALNKAYKSNRYELVEYLTENTNKKIINVYCPHALKI